MANRSFNRKQALEKEVKELYASVSIGATGAPTLDSPHLGIESIKRNNAGDYTLVLEDRYSSLKSVHISHKSETPENLMFQLHSESVATDREIRFLTLATDVDNGAIVIAPTDPANGTKLLIKIDVKNTSVR